MKRYFPDIKFLNRNLYQYFPRYLDFFLSATQEMTSMRYFVRIK